MEHRRTVRVVEKLEACGLDLAAFVADIEVSLHPECGNGYDEPREAAHAEFYDVKQISGPHIQPEELRNWAETWLDADHNHQRVMHEADDRPF